MHLKVMVPVFVAFVVTVVGISAVNAEELVLCPVVDDKGVNATLLPNPYNCSTFYLCSQGVPELIECPRALHFNRKLNVCDFPWRAACVELELPTEPALPTTDAPVVTEKIVITKTVKEVYKPVDEPTL
ncbi:peritrophin-1 [Dermacentor silvarum]|nr:peritrophin-1 [Dermacentor silvarum]XP_037572901.1 peritrophin-1 [Dermacentor silvarum]